MKPAEVIDATISGATTFASVFTACYFAAKIGDYQFDFVFVSFLSGGFGLGNLLGKLAKAWQPRSAQDIQLN